MGRENAVFFNAGEMSLATAEDQHCKVPRCIYKQIQEREREGRPSDGPHAHVGGTRSEEEIETPRRRSSASRRERWRENPPENPQRRGLGSVARRNRRGREKKQDTQRGNTIHPTPRLVLEVTDGEEKITQLEEKLQVLETELAKCAGEMEIHRKEKEAQAKAMEEERTRHCMEMSEVADQHQNRTTEYYKQKREKYQQWRYQERRKSQLRIKADQTRAEEDKEKRKKEEWKDISEDQRQFAEWKKTRPLITDDALRNELVNTKIILQNLRESHEPRVSTITQQEAKLQVAETEKPQEEGLKPTDPAPLAAHAKSEASIKDDAPKETEKKSSQGESWRSATRPHTSKKVESLPEDWFTQSQKKREEEENGTPLNAENGIYPPWIGPAGETVAGSQDPPSGQHHRGSGKRSGRKTNGEVTTGDYYGEYSPEYIRSLYPYNTQCRLGCCDFPEAPVNYKTGTPLTIWGELVPEGTIWHRKRKFPPCTRWKDEDTESDIESTDEESREEWKYNDESTDEEMEGDTDESNDEGEGGEAKHSMMDLMKEFADEKGFKLTKAMVHGMCMASEHRYYKTSLEDFVDSCMDTAEYLQLAIEAPTRTKYHRLTEMECDYTMEDIEFWYEDEGMDKANHY